MVDAWVAAGVETLRHGRHPWEAEIPTHDLAAASFPKLVFSGGHSPAFDAVCDALADGIAARRLVIGGPDTTSR